MRPERIPLFPLNVVLLPGADLPLHIFEPRYREMVRRCLDDKSEFGMLLAITGQQALLDQNPLLARSIKNRFPYLDPLNHVQIELLKRHRASDTDERVVEAIHLTINGIAAGLRNSG